VAIVKCADHRTGDEPGKYQTLAAGAVPGGGQAGDKQRSEDAQVGDQHWNGVIVLPRWEDHVGHDNLDR
jgi:hypothetical protein